MLAENGGETDTNSVESIKLYCPNANNALYMLLSTGSHLSKHNNYIQAIFFTLNVSTLPRPSPYVSVMVSFPFGSRTVATGAL
jgi:hypothetical protein